MSPFRYVVLLGLALGSACGGASSASCSDDACGDSDGSSSGTAIDPDTAASTRAASESTTGTTDAPSNTTEDGTLEDDSSGSPPAECPAATHRCLDAAPEGWTGPLVLRHAAADETPSECSGQYSEDLGTWSLDPTTEAQTCSCTCGDASGVDCDSWITHGPSSCIFNNTTIQAFTNNCINIADTGNDYWIIASEPSDGSCLATADHDVPEVEYAGSVRACGGAVVSEGCGDTEVCAPIPSAPVAARWCIFREGEHECPSEGSYIEGETHFTDDNDTRACTGCNCAAPVGTCNNPSASLFTDDACTGPATFGGTVTGACEVATNAGAATIRAVRRTTGGTFVGECQATGGTEIGSFTPTDPITFCCTR